MLTRVGKSFMTIQTEDTRISSVGKTPKLTPFNFDKFVPWVCSQWCASTAVVVTRLAQEKYIRHDHKKPKSLKGSRKSRISNVLAPHQGESSTAVRFSSSGSFKGLQSVMPDNVVQVNAYYDEKAQLVEIAIVRCTNRISRRVIHAISLCVPYHYLLTKFSLRRGGLTSELIYEIDKLLPLSNITELCFDDSYVKEGNYYILLEQYSQLQYLSLNRCRINDEICKKIFKSLDFDAPAAKTLQILELGSNQITDIGAIYIGSVLKMNRCLLHLNLSGNKITDKGFRAVITVLKEFPLADEENMAAKARRLGYLKNKNAVYQRCLYELKYGKDDDSTGTSGKRMYSMTSKKLRRKSRKIMTDPSMILDHAETMAKAIAGKFIDPYAPENVVVKNGVVFSKGNLILCSLNMAYNDLEFPSVTMLYDVVCYQSEIEKMAPDTGLMRITLDGNNMPSSCWELDEIDAYLKNLIIGRLPLVRKTRTSSILRRMLARQSTSGTSRS